jgi:hypothetical protein
MSSGWGDVSLQLLDDTVSTYLHLQISWAVSLGEFKTLFIAELS